MRNSAKIKNKHIYQIITGSSTNDELGFWKEVEGRTKDDHERFWKTGSRIEELKKEFDFNSIQEVNSALNALGARKTKLPNQEEFKNFLEAKEKELLLPLKKANEKIKSVKSETIKIDEFEMPTIKVLNQYLKESETQKPTHLEPRVASVITPEHPIAVNDKRLEEQVKTYAAPNKSWLRKTWDRGKYALAASVLGVVCATSGSYKTGSSTAGEPNAAEKMIKETSPKEKELTPEEKKKLEASEAKAKAAIKEMQRPKVDRTSETFKKIKAETEKENKKTKEYVEKVVKSEKEREASQKAAAKFTRKKDEDARRRSEDPSAKDVLEFGLEDLVTDKKGKIVRGTYISKGPLKGQNWAYQIKPSSTKDVLPNVKNADVKLIVSKKSSDTLEFRLGQATDAFYSIQIQSEKDEKTGRTKVSLYKTTAHEKKDKKGNFAGFDYSKPRDGGEHQLKDKTVVKIDNLLHNMDLTRLSDNVMAGVYSNMLMDATKYVEDAKDNLEIKANRIASREKIYKEAKERLPGRFDKEFAKHREELAGTLGKRMRQLVDEKQDELAKQVAKEWEGKYGIEKGELTQISKLKQTKDKIAALKETYKAATPEAQADLRKQILDEYAKIRKFNHGVEKDLEEFVDKYSGELKADLMAQAGKSKTKADWTAYEQALKRYAHGLKDKKDLEELTLIGKKGTLKREIDNQTKTINKYKDSKLLIERAQAHTAAQRRLANYKRLEALEKGDQYAKEINDAEVEKLLIEATLPQKAIPKETPKTPVVSGKVVTLPKLPKAPRSAYTPKKQKGLFEEGSKPVEVSGEAIVESGQYISGEKGEKTRVKAKVEAGPVSVGVNSTYKNTQRDNVPSNERVSELEKSAIVELGVKPTKNSKFTAKYNRVRSKENRKGTPEPTITTEAPDLTTTASQLWEQDTERAYDASEVKAEFGKFYIIGRHLFDNQETYNNTRDRTRVVSPSIPLDLLVRTLVDVNTASDRERMEAVAGYKFYLPSNVALTLGGEWTRQETDLEIEVMVNEELASLHKEHLKQFGYGAFMHIETPNLDAYAKAKFWEGDQVDANEELEGQIAIAARFGNLSPAIAGARRNSRFDGYAGAAWVTSEEGFKAWAEYNRTQLNYLVDEENMTLEQRQDIINDLYRTLPTNVKLFVRVGQEHDGEEDRYVGVAGLGLGKNFSLGVRGGYDPDNELEDSWAPMVQAGPLTVEWENVNGINGNDDRQYIHAKVDVGKAIGAFKRWLNNR